VLCASDPDINESFKIQTCTLHNSSLRQIQASFTQRLTICAVMTRFFGLCPSQLFVCVRNPDCCKQQDEGSIATEYNADDQWISFSVAGKYTPFRFTFDKNLERNQKYTTHLVLSRDIVKLQRPIFESFTKCTRSPWGQNNIFAQSLQTLY